MDVGVLLHGIQGTGCFRVYSENTNSDVYYDIFDNYLVPTVQLYGLEDEFMFQHDNARYHTTKQAHRKLQELNVKVLKWSAKSSDLNPIEHLCSIIDNKLKSRRISSVKDLTDGLSAE